jgi:hypothetical protein
MGSGSGEPVRNLFIAFTGAQGQTQGAAVMVQRVSGFVASQCGFAQPVERLGFRPRSPISRLMVRVNSIDIVRSTANLTITC